MTRSYLHLHVGLDASGLNMSALQPHYTVFDDGMVGEDGTEHVIKDRNMIAVSNPCVLDPSLAPAGKIMMHAYACGNEEYEVWEKMERGTPEYEEVRSQEGAFTGH